MCHIYWIDLNILLSINWNYRLYKGFDIQSHQYHYFFNQSVIGTSLREIGNNLEGFDDNWHVDKVSENQPKNKQKNTTTNTNNF